MHLSFFLFFFFFAGFYKAPSLFISPFRDRGWVYAGSASDGCLGCCPALFHPELCWWMLCCAILYSFSAPLCCANMDWPIGYGWQGTVWADRCLGQSCWAGLMLTGGLGWMDPCSRASRGGGPKSRLKPGSETVMRGTMCQDWQGSSTTRYPRQYPALLVSPCLLSPLFSSPPWHRSPLNKTLFSPPFSHCSASVLFGPPPSSTPLPPPHSLAPLLLCLSSPYWPGNLRRWGASVCAHELGCVASERLLYREDLKSRLWKWVKQLVSAVDKDLSRDWHSGYLIEIRLTPAWWASDFCAFFFFLSVWQVAGGTTDGGRETVR